MKPRLFVFIWEKGKEGGSMFDVMEQISDLSEPALYSAQQDPWSLEPGKPDPLMILWVSPWSPFPVKTLGIIHSTVREYIFRSTHGT